MKKQLITAALFLIISLVALGTVSYAWFSRNEKVEATGMSISVKAPINVMASLDASESVTSLSGFQSFFTFGSMTGEGENTTVSEYDMLVPVTSANGIYFAYLPFRHVAADGCPKEGTKLSDYQILNRYSNSGYFIDIPLYLTTTNFFDLEVYVKSINIFDPLGNNTITGAVRCAVLKKDGDSYSTMIYAKDSGAEPLVRDVITFYPLLCDGTNLVEQSVDNGVPETSDDEDEYILDEKNSLMVKKCKKVNDIVTYYTTEIRIRVWVEGTDKSAIHSNAGAYFAVSVELAVNNQE